MAVTRRGYIFCAFLSSILCILFILVVIASDSWIVSTARTQSQSEDSLIRYGMFRGEFVLNTLQTPSVSVLHMTCVSNVSSCAVSCKTTPEAREAEVFALSQGFRPSTTCNSLTEIDTSNPMPNSPVIGFALYVCLLLVLFLMLVFAVVSAGLAILNATMNPTEPIFGLPGCLWSNILTAVTGLIGLITFGSYWAASGLKGHLAFSYISVERFVPNPALGYSYWLLIPAIMCSIANVVLIQARAYLLERDPPPPEIKVENHSDGTIFLY